MVTELFDPLAAQMSTARDDHPATIELWTSELVGLIRTIAADEPILGGPIPVLPSDVMGETPPADAEALLTSAVFTLAENQRFGPEAAFVDCIRAPLPFCDPRARADLEGRLTRLEAEVGAAEWADSIWNAESVGGWLDGDAIGDLCNVGVELSWPGDWSDRVLFGSVRIQDGPFTRDFVVTTLEQYQEVFEDASWAAELGMPPLSEDDAIDTLESIEAVEAVGLLKQAMDNTDAMDDPDIADDYADYAPLARQTLENLESAEPPRPSTLNDEQRHDVIDGFLGSPDVVSFIETDGDPGLPGEFAWFCELFIDYSERYAGGDVYRWSPMVVEGFLHNYGNNVDSSVDTDDLLLPVMIEWIEHCHRIKGWADSITDEAKDALNGHLLCAIDPNEGGGDAFAGQFGKLLAGLASELISGPNEPVSVDELINTWNPHESWPAEGDSGTLWAGVPAPVVERCEAVLALAEPVMGRSFAPEHLTSAQRMITDLAVDHTETFTRGRPDVWAAAVTYAVAQVHHAFTQVGRMFGVPEQLSPQQLVDAFPTVSKGSITSKATKVRDLLDADGSRRYIYDLASEALAALAVLNDWS